MRLLGGWLFGFHSRFYHLIVLCSLCAAVVATSDEAPVLQITKTGTNTHEIGITNGTNTGYYELYHTPALADPVYSWTLLIVGTQGQTNFPVTNLVNFTGYYTICVSKDWDGDSVENYQDANLNSTNICVLTILIYSSTN